MFVGKAWSLPKAKAPELANIGLVRKDQPETNTLAYLQKFVNYSRKKSYNFGPIFCIL
jgi:hypothetical protein